MSSFRLVSDKWVGYFTGTAGENQVILGFQRPGIVAVFFDDAGKLLRVEEDRLDEDILVEWSRPPYDPRNPDKELRPRSFQRLRTVAAKIGFEEAAITIQPFDLESSYSISMNPVTGEIQEILDNPDDYSQAERIEAREYLRQANEGVGPFAFQWDQEFLMNPDGTINTT
jgi:hypothetical protein